MSGNRSNLSGERGSLRGEERKQFKRRRKTNSLGREGRRESRSIIILGIGQRWFAYRIILTVLQGRRRK